MTYWIGGFALMLMGWAVAIAGLTVANKLLAHFGWVRTLGVVG